MNIIHVSYCNDVFQPGQWLQDQRKEKRYGNLRPDRHDRLNALVEEGLLDWRPTRYDEKKWLTRFEAVVAFAAENGNCEIPSGEMRCRELVYVSYIRYTRRGK
jgi:hypothetical protein